MKPFDVNFQKQSKGLCCYALSGDVLSPAFLFYNIMLIMYCLQDKSQTLYFPAVFQAGGHDIDSGGVHAAVAQNVRQLGNVLFQTIEGSGEQLAQIVGKHLAGLHPGFFAQSLHLRPNIAPVQRLSVSGNKDCSTTSILLETCQSCRKPDTSFLTPNKQNRLCFRKCSHISQMSRVTGYFW